MDVRSVRTSRFAAIAVLLLFAGYPIPAAELEAAAVMDGLQAWLDQTRDLRGKFVQTMTSGALGSGIVESGELYLLRPGRMRWDYREPERKVALIDGERTWLYVEEDRQLLEGRLEYGESLLPRLLAARQPIRELFRGVLLETPRRGKRGAYRLQLLPIEDAPSLRQVVLTLDPSEFSIREAEVLDGAGNQMRYAFSDLRRNRGVPAGIFEFEPPEGTERIRAD